MTEYLLLIAAVYALNLLPAFGPPTWTLLVFFTVKYDLATVPTILLGAFAAAAGRYTLANGAKLFRGRLKPRRTVELDALRDAAESNPNVAYALLGLFALSPVPSAQLFAAAGLTGVRLLPLTVAFFSGRVISYTIYVTAAKTAKDSIEQIMRQGWNSPWAIVLQALMLAFLIALLLAPWSKLLARWLPQAHDSSAA